MDEPPFKTGDRVRLSERGRQNARKPECRGRVVSASRSGGAFKVQWDGLKTTYMVHHSYLEADEG